MAEQYRPTLAQFAAEARGEGPDGWGCPRCGCRDWRVENSYMTGDGRKRRRICRNCGQEVMHTLEVPVRPGFRIAVVSDDDESPPQVPPAVITSEVASAAKRAVRAPGKSTTRGAARVETAEIAADEGVPTVGLPPAIAVPPPRAAGGKKAGAPAVKPPDRKGRKSAKK